MKIRLAVAVVLCMSINLVNSTPVIAGEVDLTLNALYSEYKEDEQFQLMLADYGEEYAKDFLDDVAQRRMEEMMRGGGGNICYEYVTNIMQTKSYNCGSTTVLQTLYGLGCASNVSGNSNADKISTLDTEYNVDEQGSLYVYQVQNALNKYSDRTYIYDAGSSMTQAAFEDKVAASLTNCRPVILHARTEYIGYYAGHASGHYISLDYVDRTADTVRLVDCNNNEDFYGIHNDVDIADAYKSITPNGTTRYLIY